MKLNNIKEISLFEHRFWLQVLGDHSRFIFNALPPNETFLISESKKFIDLFDNLLEKSYRANSEKDISELNSKAHSATLKLRELKLSIICKKITDKIDINLAPTLLNHMVNELDEYMHILDLLIEGKEPVPKKIHIHLLWLSDGMAHASTVISNLDMTQKELIKKGKEYSKIFTDLYLRTIEYKGYTRTGICDFPALRKHDKDVDEKMGCFKEFLKELKEHILENKVLGTLSPLMADHMFREECYYLIKLSMVSPIKEHKCDPGKPRYMHD